MATTHCSLLRFLPAAALVAGCGTTASAAGDAGSTDAAASALPFQPSNIASADINAQRAAAAAESISSDCVVKTDKTAPIQDCFASPIAVVAQADGTTVNLIVVASLQVAASATVRVTGAVPLIVVSLGDVTLAGAFDGHSASLNVGPGGAVGAQSNSAGSGPSGGTAAVATAAVGGSGGTFCGIGGLGGGQTLAGTSAGAADLRPLKGGSSGGGGSVGSGAGGGAIQISAAGTLTIASSGAISVGGQGGPIGGIAANQNAGGGGSGGGILLEATDVALAGTLAANGGGGGGDYSGTGGADATANATPAAGGAAGSSDGAGGTGAAAAASAGSAGTVPGGLNAGGGGGGAGWIRVNTASGAAVLGATVSPAAATACASVGKVRAANTAP